MKAGSVLGLVLVGLLGCAGASPSRALPNPFHVFHFCMAQLTPERQAALAREVGYDGLAFEGAGDRRILEQVAAYQRDRQTPLAALLWRLHYDAPEPFDPVLIDELARALSGTGTLLWLTVDSDQPWLRDEPEDRRAAQVIQRFADIARRHGVTVALYPHDGEYLASAEHALRLIHLAERAGARDNLKLSLHLCHELRAGNGARLAEVVEATLPHVAVVSISGANRAVTPGSLDWSDTIQVLGEGDYDVQGFVNTLVDAGYTGPIVLHTYGLQGEPRDLLTRAFRAWRTLAATAAERSGPP